MSTLRFTDGISFDTSGPLRLAMRADGAYVIGDGMMIPVRDLAEGRQLIENIEKTRGGTKSAEQHAQVP